MIGDFKKVRSRAEKHLREMYASAFPDRELELDLHEFDLEVMLHVAIALSLEELKAERKAK